jgi:hypothetical protein
MLGSKISFELDGFVYIAEILTYSGCKQGEEMKIKILSYEEVE